MQIIDVNSWYKFMIDALLKGPNQTAPQLLCVGLPRKRHQWSAHESREVLAATVVFQWSATGKVQQWLQPADSSQGIGMKKKHNHLKESRHWWSTKKHHDIMESQESYISVDDFGLENARDPLASAATKICAKLRVQLQLLCAGRNSSRMALVAPSTMSSKTTQGIPYMFPSSCRSLLSLFMMEIHGKSIYRIVNCSIIYSRISFP